MAVEQLQRWIASDRGRPRVRDISVALSPESSGITQNNFCKIITLPATGTGNTILAYWQNPEAVKLMIWQVILEVTDASANACTVEMDVTTGAAVNGDTIFDGVALNATGISSLNDAALGGNADQLPKIMDELGGTNDYFTVYEKANQAVTSFAGKVYIFYTTLV